MLQLLGQEYSGELGKHNGCWFIGSLSDMISHSFKMNHNGLLGFSAKKIKYNVYTHTQSS